MTKKPNKKSPRSASSKVPLSANQQASPDPERKDDTNENNFQGPPPLEDDDPRKALERQVLERSKGHVVLSQLIRTFGNTDSAYVLLLGAGTSHSSGIPVVSEIVDAWQKLLFKEKSRKDADSHEDSYRAWLESEYVQWKRQRGDGPDYPILFNYFYSERGARQRHIEELMDGKTPTMGYVYLAGLIHAGFFNRILTTNFDEMISDALYRYYDRRAYSLAFDSALSSIRLDSPRPKVFKLHGDFLYDNIKNLRQELNRLDVLMEEKLYRICADSGLIVIGYGGNDSSIMGPLRDMLRRGEYLKLGLHWCIQKPRNKEKPRIPDRVLDLAQEYPERVHIYLIDGFDELMEEVFIGCRAPMSQRLADPLNQNLVIDLITATRQHGASLKTPSTNQYLSDFGACLSGQTRSFSTFLVLADNRWSSGRSAQDEERFTDALSMFREAIDLIESAFQQADFETAPLSDRLSAEGRATGIYLGTAEEERRIGTSDWAELLTKVEYHATRATELESEPGYNSVAVNHRSRHIFNSICALGLAVFGGVRPKGEIGNELRALLSRLRPIDRDGTYLAELRDPSIEPSCRSISDMLPQTWSEFRTKQ